jgi:hypothetical protein
MLGRYAYSLNGEDYQQSFATRNDAEEAGMEAARRAAEPPQTIYVARMVEADPKASGHARVILSNMTVRAREEAGAAGDGYLAQISKAQIDDLDMALEKTILQWLERHDLKPTYLRAEAISEHPVLGAAEPLNHRMY